MTDLGTCITLDDGSVYCANEKGEFYRVKLDRVNPDQLPPRAAQELIIALYKHIGERNANN